MMCARYVNKPPFHINSTSKYYQIMLLTLPAGRGLHLEIISSNWEASKVPLPRQRASWPFCGWIPSSLNTQALSNPPPVWSTIITCSPPKWTHWCSFLCDGNIMTLFWPPSNSIQESSRGAQSSKFWFYWGTELAAPLRCSHQPRDNSTSHCWVSSPRHQKWHFLYQAFSSLLSHYSWASPFCESLWDSSLSHIDLLFIFLLSYSTNFPGKVAMRKGQSGHRGEQSVHRGPLSHI